MTENIGFGQYSNILIITYFFLEVKMNYNNLQFLAIRTSKFPFGNSLSSFSVIPLSFNSSIKYTMAANRIETMRQRNTRILKWMKFPAMTDRIV